MDVGLFWDYENVRRPKSMDTYTVCSKLRDFFSKEGRLCERRLYYDSRKQTEIMTDREGFDMSGFTLVDCPTRGKKEAVDKKIIVDICSFAYGRLLCKKPPTVVLLSSDGDYAYMLNRLRDEGVRIVIVHGRQPHEALVRSADLAVSWRFNVLEPDTEEPSGPETAVAVKQEDYCERFLVFLLSVREAQRARSNGDWRDQWAYESHVGTLFYKDALPGSKADRRRAFKKMKTDALEEKLLADSKSHDHSDVLMLMLTAKGRGIFE